ncbi:LarC family nickel insertion protein [Nitratireductor basaltis]|uniref:Nickel insertion protein n=1 Tax=Nitratireductor basaltis TaxID=472175 RepID=A0A084UEP3_9HYPH|nr:LarC family nickel insertion protein [Nitratireductor basaltis]KFB11429.1 hypothetical protein EL18_02477 [Nitratireductor basaltis]
MPRHLHLDPVGGIAGDMFAASLLHLAPELQDEAIALAQSLMPGHAEVGVEQGPFGGFAGLRLNVECAHQHHHRHLSDLLRIIEASPHMPDEAADISRSIFTHLAQAEAAVHGTTEEKVHFHEVGAVDSIIDIALAGFLLSRLNVASVSLAPLPLGGGTVKTEHGVMPVPAPATTHLLGDLAIVDDGIAGERVTPTGAAILAHLRPRMLEKAPSGRLHRSGHGFGMRELPGRPNMLRVLEIEVENDNATFDRLAELSFEIDDQTGEDLAHALDLIRAQEGVRDALQYAVLGKKGRMAASVRVLCMPEAVHVATQLIFEQTSTLGIREALVTRHLLERTESVSDQVRVKQVKRPSAVTAKAEFDDLKQKAQTRAEREELRRKLEGGNG